MIIFPRITSVLGRGIKPFLRFDKIVAGIFWACLVPAAIAQDADQDLTSIQSGTHNGFYYNVWKDSGNITFGLREAGRYTAQWSDVSSWVGGVGWSPGDRDKVVNYSGQFIIDPSQNAYLSLYGWTRNPLVEYYILESWGAYDPSSCIEQRKTYGTFESDGATYQIISCKIYKGFGIVSDYTQIFSVRTSKKDFGAVEGTITLANHFDTWESKDLKLGQLDYMIFAVDAYQSNGSADITVTDATPLADCGEIDGVPICCNIDADPDGDGIGVQNNGQVCMVDEEAVAGGGSSGWWFLAISGLLMARRRMVS